jgi:xanthine dehydrogenase YagS FAD-binding subunit
MRDFGYVRAAAAAEAVTTLHEEPDARLIAGGTDMVNLLKERIERPRLVVDVSRVPLDQVTCGTDGLRIGALATLSAVAADPAVRESYPALAQAVLLSASPQLRNMATVGGNLLQRTRCPYFRAETDLPCNRRRPGSGCAAIKGDHRTAAIVGTSAACVASHPSDLAVALVVLDATVRILGPAGARGVPLAELYRLPGEQPHRETVLDTDEMIVRIDVPPAVDVAASRYVKVRGRASYEFALVSAAVAIGTADGVITRAGVAVGGVAPKPWRLPEVEHDLVGRPARHDAVRAAVEPAFDDAHLLPGNAYKVELAKRAVLRAVTGGPAQR